jgi:hypothetical protein
MAYFLFFCGEEVELEGGRKEGGGCESEWKRAKGARGYCTT